MFSIIITLRPFKWLARVSDDNYAFLIAFSLFSTNITCFTQWIVPLHVQFARV